MLRCYARLPLFSSLSCLRQKEVVLKFRIGPWHALVCFSYNSSCLIQFRFEGGHNFVGLCHRFLFTGCYRIQETGFSFVMPLESTLYLLPIRRLAPNKTQSSRQLMNLEKPSRNFEVYFRGFLSILSLFSSFLSMVDELTFRLNASDWQKRLPPMTVMGKRLFIKVHSSRMDT